MKKTLMFLMTMALMMSCNQKKEESGAFTGAPGEVKLLTLAPGHFHAALVQKTSYPQVNKDVYVYAPEGDEVVQHLEKIKGYNTRADEPTSWNEIVYTGDNYLQRMIAEKKGNVMVVAGNNRKKTEYIKTALDNGIHVLADKPMAINPENFQLLKSCFETAEKNGLLLYDIMTERYEITSILQRELAHIPGLFGEFVPGTPESPAVVKESVHHFSKLVSGAHLLRPAWFFDVEQEGDGIVDVTTHLVDLIQWGCFPEEIIDYTKDVEIFDANRWATTVDPAQFKQVTQMDSYPDYLQKDVKDGVLHVYSNGDILYKLKGLYAKISVIWNFEAPPGIGDTHFSIMRGTKANLVIRQGAEQDYKPTLYVEAANDTNNNLKTDLDKVINSLLPTYPGISVEEVAGGWKVNIPESYSVGHEAHFGEVTERYLHYLIDGKLPDWEVPNMIAKYYVTTEALRIAKSK
ncbi:putative dehydrogenase [Parabacteroides sp. PFB2-10]|uniref:putative oxidoreductase C-terminal domain-containing protein n=1 Tax=Parabacteroides sp. PFB2-10 TaxID=1742405 RepID=UPI002475B09A|nr:putative oxidoreductase C-terminal domain-containing protein [Parabacteroides sp. PFB2-10]MDH6313390.1 putative dehydrogenase [Parabacteroides sp. PFB2-10]